jgi:aromatic ring-opening dioxygenase catalytic subunit (LigB family)
MMKQVYFVPHGGGPLPLMGDVGHQGVIDLMRGLETSIANSKAIVLITAHWESDKVQISGTAEPSLLFDYYNFPPETYDYEYPARGAPDLALKTSALLTSAGFSNQIDTERGFDHGTFVPMMLMRPKADIPILQMSLLASLDSAEHIAYGRALAPLLDQNITIIGSGLSFHNLGAMLGGQTGAGGEDETFDKWLNDTLTNPDKSEPQRGDALTNWSAAPGARFCHPREEHLLPLHVCYGAASAAGLRGENIYQDKLLGFTTSGFRWT